MSVFSAKHFTASRTLWAMFLVELLLQALDNVPQLQAALPERAFAWLAFASPLVAMALRFITRRAVRMRREPRWD